MRRSNEHSGFGLRPLAAAVLPFFLAANARAERFTIDRAHTSVAFEVHVFGAEAEHGRFGRVTGTVSLRPRRNQGSVDISIDARSLRMNHAALGPLIRGGRFLDVQRYSMISYKASQVVFVGGEPARIDGLLTLRGFTKAVPLNVTEYRCATREDHDDCVMSATATLNRSEFGMTGYGAVVSNQTRLTIRAEGVSVEPSRHEANVNRKNAGKN